MKLNLLACLALAALAISPALAIAQADSDMLERSLPGVVTVAVYNGDDLQHPFGFGATNAYERLLNLSGAADTGSGFCIDHNNKKYIITNCHVIENASDAGGSIVAYGVSRTKYTMKIVGADSFMDIAVLEFKGKQPGEDVTPLKLSKDEPRLGEKVFAIGNPYGEYPYAVSNGIVGGLNRVRGGLTGKFGYLESTATVAWGSSGGPLIDEKGEVVGINTGIEIRRRFQQMVVQPQINFALEAGLAARAIDQILDIGHVRRAFLGIEFTQDFALQKKHDGEVVMDIGASPIIADLLPDSPAAAALADWKGATVKKINDRAIANIEELLAALEEIKPGDHVTLQLQREGNVNDLQLQAVEMTPDLMAAWAARLLEKLGLQVTAENEGLSLGHISTEPDHVKRFDLDDTPAGFRPAAGAQPAQSPLLAIGLFDDKGEAQYLWRTSNLKELGIAVRLTALDGRIDLANRGQGDQFNIMRLWLSGEEGKLRRSLLY